MLPRMRSTALTALAALVLAPTAGAWSWPVSGPVLRPFRLGDDPYLGGQHRGIDVAGAAGEAVVAPDDGDSVTLTHLGAISVKRNATVEEGARVGVLGPSGSAEWPRPYVHLGVRADGDPNGYLDPLQFLPARSAPAGPPTPVAAGAPPAPASHTAPAPAPPAQAP